MRGGARGRNPAQLGPQFVQLHPRRIAQEEGRLVDGENVTLQPLQPHALDVIDATTTPVSQSFVERDTTPAIVLLTGIEGERRPPRTRQTLEEF